MRKEVTRAQFVLVAVAALSTSRRDQRRKSGLYFRGRGEKRGKWYVRELPSTDYIRKKQMFGPSALIKR